MVAVTPYWRNNPSEIFGGIISLELIPLYSLVLINRLSVARQEAEEANRAKSLFLASVSHELRTPLNAIIGMGAMLESSDLRHEQRKMSRTIMTAARSLLSLIDGVLDLSKAEAGQISVVQANFNLAKLLDQIRTIFVAEAHRKGVQVNIHITSRTPLLLHGDERKLHEILVNLIGNGLKFTEMGSVTVAVDAEDQPQGLLRFRFEVTDTGIGIVPQAQARIFEVFTQADETIGNRFGGTGLGLAIARNAVRFLGGEIGVESVPKKGSIFWFELLMQPQKPVTGVANPVHAYVVARNPDSVASLLGRLIDCGVSIAHSNSMQPAWPTFADPSSVSQLAFIPTNAKDGSDSTSPCIFIDVCQGVAAGFPVIDVQRNYASILHLPVTDNQLSNLLQLVHVLFEQSAMANKSFQPVVAKEKFRLLVADDNATNRYVIETILSSAGHTVSLVNNGEEALDALEKEIFDAALLDLNMPVMGGIEAAKIYRMTTAGHTSIPLIALTADSTSASRESCLTAGMAVCLVKPIEPLKLLEVIDEVITTARDRQVQHIAVSPDPRVVAIAGHPRFRTNLVAAVDVDVLSRLHKLGGEKFLTEVCNLFRDEARSAVLELHGAAALGDVLRFRTNAHALRSVAANVGAHQLCEICLPFQSTSAVELMQSSTAWLSQITDEVTRIDTALTNYCNSPTAQSNR